MIKCFFYYSYIYIIYGEISEENIWRKYLYKKPIDIYDSRWFKQQIIRLFYVTKHYIFQQLYYIWWYLRLLRFY